MFLNYIMGRIILMLKFRPKMQLWQLMMLLQ